MSIEVKGVFKDYVDDDEVLLGTIHKHSFGLLIVYLMAALGMILALGLAFTLLPKALPAETAYSVAVGFSALAILFGFVVIIASTIIYHQSSIVITDKNITQILQNGLFGRKVSQLTMANVEDVSAAQHGLFATMLDFGVLQVETAGEQENFVFDYCPRPGYYAKIILEAREKFMMTHEYSHMNSMPGQHMQQYAPPPVQEATPQQPANPEQTPPQPPQA